MVPKSNLSEHQKLSKIATLRLAIHYISALTSTLKSTGAAILPIKAPAGLGDRRGRRRGRGGRKRKLVEPASSSSAQGGPSSSSSSAASSSSVCSSSSRSSAGPFGRINHNTVAPSDATTFVSVRPNPAGGHSAVSSLLPRLGGKPLSRASHDPLADNRNHHNHNPPNPPNDHPPHHHYYAKMNSTAVPGDFGGACALDSASDTSEFSPPLGAIQDRASGGVGGPKAGAGSRRGSCAPLSEAGVFYRGVASQAGCESPPGGSLGPAGGFSHASRSDGGGSSRQGIGGGGREGSPAGYLGDGEAQGGAESRSPSCPRVGGGRGEVEVAVAVAVGVEAGAGAGAGSGQSLFLPDHYRVGGGQAGTEATFCVL